MLSLEQIHTFSQKKHGKPIILGCIAILVTLLSAGIFSLVSSNPSTKSSLIKTQEKIVETDTKQSEDEIPQENLERYGDINSKFSAKESTKECDNRFPTNAYKKVYRKDWAVANTAKSELQLENRTKKPIWVRLIHPNSSFPIIAIMVYPFETVTETINIGRYGVEFSTGTQWCNSFLGITDGKTMGLAKELQLPKTSSVLLRILSDNQNNLDAIITNLPRVSKDPNDIKMVIEK
jgi:uncharacterized protein YxeA